MNKRSILNANSLQNLAQNPKFATFFTHPMRLFFVSAAIFAALGALSFFISTDFVSAHKIYFLNLSPACAYAGFLLVAFPDWTNYTKRIFFISFALYFAVLLAFALSFFSPQIYSVFMCVFWFLLFAFCAYLSALDRNSDNLSILLILFCYFALEVAYVFTQDDKFINAFIHLNVIAIVIVSFRISVVLGAIALENSNLKDPVFIPNFIHKNIFATLGLFYIFCSLFYQYASGFVALGLGFVMLAKLKELHFIVLLRRYFVAFYYLFELSCACGYIWLGVDLLGGADGVRALHLIALCYLFAMILFVFLVAGLRHSGFVELKFPTLSVIALFLLFCAGISRSIFAPINLGFYIHIPATFVILASIFYLINFFKIFANHAFSDDPE